MEAVLRNWYSEARPDTAAAAARWRRGSVAGTRRQGCILLLRRRRRGSVPCIIVVIAGQLRGTRERNGRSRRWRFRIGGGSPEIQQIRICCTIITTTQHIRGAASTAFSFAQMTFRLFKRRRNRLLELQVFFRRGPRRTEGGIRSAATAGVSTTAASATVSATRIRAGTDRVLIVSAATTSTLSRHAIVRRRHTLDAQLVDFGHVEKALSVN